MMVEHWCTQADNLLQAFRNGNREYVLSSLDAMPQDRAMSVVARMMVSLVASGGHVSGFEGRYEASSFMRLLSDRIWG